MDDGNEFSFRTDFDMEFFEVPEGYTADQMKDVVPHKTVKGQLFENRPYFDCYLKLG